MAADAKGLFSASIRVIRGQAPHSAFFILHSCFILKGLALSTLQPKSRSRKVRFYNCL